jgi:hypothetical protein
MAKKKPAEKAKKKPAEKKVRETVWICIKGKTIINLPTIVADKLIQKGLAEKADAPIDGKPYRKK